ncbi:class I SAM-dependent methyltransferase [Natronobiforma cellulositropha]|uniref:class I SAM-dependent methyltransferase n=1 Tax=Natronobiforma cellulositropha TaxID=1679076 RepID=UPI0021D604E9|nr:methyltransferase domain-containing protein [Natronobiforma cellulositropha]
MSEDSSLPTVAPGGSLEFADAWRAVVTDDRNRWSDPEDDYAFWDDHAADYEARFVGDPEGLAAIDALVDGTDSVLEIGPGTGRYTRELARRAARVTAVEDAPAMRRELVSNLERAGLRESVTVVPTAWEDADVDPHDVVLAAWSFYRQADVEAALETLLETARKGFVLIDTPGCLPPHRRPAVAAGDALAMPPRHAYYCGLFADRGVYPEVRFESKTRQQRAPTREALLETLFPDREEPTAYADALAPWLEESEDGWRYRYTLPVAVISWERDRVAGSLAAADAVGCSR